MTLERRIGGYTGSFTCKENELLINIVHLNKSQMLFGRFTNDIFPSSIREIADNIYQLFQIVKEIADDKITVSQQSELVLSMNIGRKSKEYVIPLEKVEMSNQQSLKKKVEELQKSLQQKCFECAFFKDQYNLLLKNLQLKPNISELQQLYARNDLSELIFGEKELKESKLTSNSSKVSSSGLKEQLKCPKQHILQQMNNSYSKFGGYRCNICLEIFNPADKRLHCPECKFDVCEKCKNIPPQHRKYCPNMHAVTFGSASRYEMRLCDICEKNLGKEKGYSCLQCDYDICKGCV